MSKFKLLLSVIAMMLLGSTAIMAQESKGYALFGAVPEGYEDLTGNVEVSTDITQSSNNITATDYTTPASITFTGKGFHGTYVCHTNVAVAVRFKNDQLLTMTDQMAIHVKMKRTDDKTEGALELSMCKKAWGGEDGRLSFEIPNTDVTTTESEVVLKYTNYSTKGTHSTYHPEYFLGEQKYFGGANNELFRVCAATGEKFEITQIYIEKTYTPEPAPTNVKATAEVTGVDKVTLNLKADCEKSTIVTYKVTYNDITKTFIGNAGETTTCVIDGLQGLTTYTFSVVAKNETGVAATAVTTNPVTTPEQKGYAIFGEVPTGYMDFTGKIKIPDGVVTDGIMSLSGTSYSYNICQEASKSLVLKVASEAVNMNLTEQFAIHVKIKKTAGVVNDVHVSFNKNDWNSCRAGFRLNATNIPEDEFKDVAIKYDSRVANINGIHCDNADKLCGNQTWNANGDFLRFAAASGEILYISQIYIEKTYTPEPAPTIVTAEVDESATEWDKVTLNLKANCEKSTVVTYEVKYGSNTKTFTGNAGELTTCVIEGLEGSTEYTFSVVAKNEDGVAASAVETTATTPAKPLAMEVRYYFYRTGDLPANSGTLTNRDLRDGKDGIFQKNSGGGNPDFEVLTDTKFAKYQLSYNWCFMRIMATEETMSDINGEWYLHLRYKTTHKKPLYANVAGHEKSMMKIADKDRACDNLWHDTVIALTDYVSKMTLPVAVGNDAFQIQNANNNIDNPGTFAIDYAYVSNTNQRLDLGYQDVTAPVMTVNQTDLTATSVSFNIAGIDDSDSKIYYTISDGTNNYEFTYNSKEAFDYQLTGLEKGTDYTITITAKDPFGNQSTWSQAITTIGDAIAPEMVSVNKGEVLDNSIELLLKANDNQEGTLTYTISVGGNTYTTTGLAGEEVSYKVSGLTPETEYEFSVVATDAGENTSAPIVVKYSTTAFVAYRYYIVGEGDASNPNHIAVACEITPLGSAVIDTRVPDYFSIKTNNHDWTGINYKPSTTVANTIDAYESNNWHLVMHFRSSIDNWMFFDKKFRVNLMNDASNYYLRTSDFWGVETLGDGQWHTVKFKLSDAAGTVPTQFLQADQIAVQLYVPGNNNYLQKDEFFDIDYLYFTNDPTEDPNPRTDRKILLHDNRINNDNYATLLEKNNGNTVDVDLNRSFVADGAWYTLCLPFSMTADQVNAAFGACKLAKLNSSELRGSSLIHLNFDYVNTIEAGVPYLFMPMADVKPVIIEDVKIDNTLKPIETTYFNMNGIFYPTQVATGDYFLGSNNYLYPVQESDNSSLKGLRAYFTIGAGAPANAQARVVMAPTVTTDLQENTITTTAEKVIKDGTIYILRGDKIYTTTGQLVK